MKDLQKTTIVEKSTPEHVTVCRLCYGSGKDQTGNICVQCNGSGRVIASSKAIITLRPYKVL